MIKSALPTLFAFVIFFAPGAGNAQFGVEVEVRYGSAIHYHEIQGADDSGQSAGLGLNLAYRTKTIWARVLRLEMKYHQISGLVNVQTLNKIVPEFDPDEPSTLVSARSHVPGLHTLSLGASIESEPLWGWLSEKFRNGAGFGILRIFPETPRVEIYEQSKEGKRIDPHPDRSFVVRDGNIFRAVPGDGFSEDDNALRSYRAYIHLQQGYQLTPYLQFFVRETYNLGKFGRPYGEAGSETLLGRIDQLEIGLVGRL